MFANEKFKRETKGRFIFLPQMALSCFYFFVSGRNSMGLLLLSGITMKLRSTSNDIYIITVVWPL